MGDERPGELGSGGTFEVFAEMPTSAEPRKGALDDPAPAIGQDVLKPLEVASQILQQGNSNPGHPECWHRSVRVRELSWAGSGFGSHTRLAIHRFLWP